jgi:hypothetical protein
MVREMLDVLLLSTSQLLPSEDFTIKAASLEKACCRPGLGRLEVPDKHAADSARVPSTLVSRMLHPSSVRAHSRIVFILSELTCFLYIVLEKRLAHKNL